MQPERQTQSRIEELIAMLDHAAGLPDVEQTTAYIKSQLCSLIRSGVIELAPAFRQPKSDRYARRQLHANEELGYTVVVMTWGPQQATPIHDHAGMWCVEGVWRGQIDVDQFELIDWRNEEYCFEKRGSYSAGVASAGCLIPPFEYHRIANPSADETAVTIHIYGGDMTRCNAFEEIREGWYRRQEKSLPLD